MADSEIQNDNPAARLLTILHKIQEYPTNTPMVQVLPSVLHVATQSALVRRIADLLDLPDLIREDVDKLDEIVSKSLLLQWTPAIEKALNSIVFQPLSLDQFRGLYTGADLTSLAFCSDLLHRHLPEQSLPSDELNGYAIRVGELLEEIEQDEQIDRELKEFLLKHLRSIRRALDGAATWGTKQVRVAVAGTIGDIILSPQIVTKSNNSPETWTKVISVLNVIAAALSFGTASLQAIEASAPSQPKTEVVVVTEQHSSRTPTTLSGQPQSGDLRRPEAGSAQHREGRRTG